VSEHIVHFFDDERSRIDTVSAFLAAAFNRNSSVLVAARPEYTRAIEETLGGWSLSLERSPRLVVVDARALARALVRGRDPFDVSVFDQQIAPVVRQLAGLSAQPVTVYGEIVDVLAQEGHLEAVHRLEACWDALSRRESLSLLCGYSSAHFVGHPHALAAVCGAHGEVHTDGSDALGRWLVGGALRRPAN